MSECFLGEIRMFAGPYAPQNWAYCDGSTQSINANQALFSLISTTYGGNGVTTFNLPDFRGRLPVGMGQGTGLTNRVLGQSGGTEAVTLTMAQTPAHTHSFNALNNAASQTAVSGNLLGQTDGVSYAGKALTNYQAQANVGTNATQLPVNSVSYALGANGASLPHDNLMPSLCINFIIAMTGIYPTQN